MASPFSTKLIALVVAPRAMAFKRLATSLNQPPTRITAFSENYLETCLSAIVCTLLMPDFGCGMKSNTILFSFSLISNLLGTSGLNLSTEIWIGKSLCPRKCYNKRSLQPDKDKIEMFLNTIETPKSVEQFKCLRRFPRKIPLQKFLRKNVWFKNRKNNKNA